MADVVKMPRMSDTMTEGTIVSWNKKVGDKIKTGDVLAEIETDKAVMDFESYLDGTLLYIGVDKGQAVAVDQVIAVIGKEGEDYKAALASAPAPTAKPAEAKTEEAPTAPQKSATPAATAKPVEAKNGSQAAVATTPTQTTPETSSGDDGKVKASPLAKKIAAENGIDLKKISGTGGDGRIIKRDVEKIKTGTPQKPAAPPLPKVSLSGEEGSNDVAVSQMRKTIARRLTESMFSAPHFYLTIEVNMDNAVSVRSQINEITGAHISYNDLVLKASALALLRHPKVNASWMGDTIRYYQHVHIGVAVAVDEGLLVPVLRFVDKKSFSDINAEVKELSKKAKDKKLQLPEMEGSTFTVSNLGMMDIDEFTAIINPPNSCILAVGAIKQVPVVITNEIKIANVMKLTMSCDHRVVDGATGAQFLQTLKRFLENPVMMLVS